MPNDWSQRVAEFPRMPITYQAMLALPEYSCTVPTGVKIGKMWRRYDGSFDRRFIERGGVPIWLIGVYEDAPAKYDPWKKQMVEMAQTVFYRPVIRVKMRRK